MENEYPFVILVNQLIGKLGSQLHLHLISFTPHLFINPLLEHILPWIPRNSIPFKQMGLFKVFWLVREISITSVYWNMLWYS